MVRVPQSEPSRVPESAPTARLTVTIDHDYRAPELRERAGGDFVSQERRGNTLWSVIGDVSAKASRGTFLAERLRRSFAEEVKAEARPSDVLRALNGALIDELDGDPYGGGFATALVWRIGSDGSVVYASAGADAQYLVRDRRSMIVPCPGDLVLGLRRDTRYRDKARRLQNGDVLIAFTDGVYESRDSVERTRRLGIGVVLRTMEILTGGGMRPAARELFERIDAFNGGRYDDDATILVAGMAASDQ
ncbi:MAG TPA: PP2C family protein-serine/threonine phosphatase [Candidatus Elarobacter sp.]